MKDLDPQKERVYAWEDSWPGWDKNHVGIRACRDLIHRACDHYGVKHPAVRVHHVRSLSFSIPSKDYISLQGWAHERQGGLNVPTALHEAAHHIAYVLYGDHIQDHGRTWFGIYLCLLVRGRVAPELALKVTARQFGIKWTETTRARPRAAVSTPR